MYINIYYSNINVSLLYISHNINTSYNLEVIGGLDNIGLYNLTYTIKLIF